VPEVYHSALRYAIENDRKTQLGRWRTRRTRVFFPTPGRVTTDASCYIAAMELVHVVRAMWIRLSPGAALEPRTELQLEAGRGIAGDHTFGRLRHVTIVFADDWQVAERELGCSVDPVARRANVLVSGGDGGRFVGCCIRLGNALVEIKGLTRPCPVMERAAPGLEHALRDGRAGIWGRILEGATLRAGDVLTATPAPAPPA